MAHDCEIRTTIYLEKKDGNDIARKKNIRTLCKIRVFSVADANKEEK